MSHAHHDHDHSAPASSSTGGSCGTGCGCGAKVKDNTPGVANAAALDCVATDPVTGGVLLIMIETRPYNGSSHRLFEVQEKVNAYLSFALDGEMAETHPHLVGKPLRLQLDTLHEPDPRTLQFIDVIRTQLATEKIGFIVNRVNLPVVTAPDAISAAKAALI